MIIDATDSILGRIAAVAAKQALKGEKVDIINAENAVVTGSKQQVLAKYKQMRERGGPYHGPYIPRQPHMLLKRTIRGMLPHKQERGQLALKRIKCHIGVPEGLVGKEAEKVANASIAKLQTSRFITLKQLTKELGVKQR